MFKVPVSMICCAISSSAVSITAFPGASPPLHPSAGLDAAPNNAIRQQSGAVLSLANIMAVVPWSTEPTRTSSGGISCADLP